MRQILPNRRLLAGAALATLLVGALVYRLGILINTGAKEHQASIEARLENSASEEKKTPNELDVLQDAPTKRLLGLKDERWRKEEELIRNLRTAWRAAEKHASELATAYSATNEELQNVSKQLDALSSQLQETEQAYRNALMDLASIRSEHDKAILHSASLEAKIHELSETARDQERRLRDDEQYLAADRDIRELMGARKLYIADVFDVDSRSRTQKPFGRIFYTQEKSLIFYAFDLDSQSAPLKHAAAFQAWGKKETDQGKPLNLGIFYTDSDHRWVLRFDDPKQLAQIDAVFVTIEPRGGSLEPTGKPFLYSLLRKRANHP